MAMTRRRTHQGGFTLIEVMVVVALIAVLATVALPAFIGTTRKAKGDAEVSPMFSDLRTRMDQYIQENGIYPTSIGEATTWPVTPTTTQQAINPLPPEWTPIKVRISGASQVYCGYTWVTGLASDSSAIGAQGTLFGFTAPTVNWYYLLAHCDFDGDPAVDSYYFTSSVDPTILKLNEGY